jgi:uncharacterized protein (TIGR02466 family)
MNLKNKNNLLIFPTFIKKCDNFLNKKECKDVIKELKKIPSKNHGALTLDKSTSSHSDISNVHIKLGNEFNSRLSSIIDEYAEEYGYEKLIISNSWHNIQYKNSALSTHCHPNSIISGVLYLKVDNLSSKLFFYNPNPHVQFSNYMKENICNFKNTIFEVENGCLIMFPSWLQHGSGHQENKSNERICLSFNTKLKYPI